MLVVPTNLFVVPALLLYCVLYFTAKFGLSSMCYYQFFTWPYWLTIITTFIIVSKCGFVGYRVEMCECRNHTRVRRGGMALVLCLCELILLSSHAHFVQVPHCLARCA